MNKTKWQIIQRSEAIMMAAALIILALIFLVSCGGGGGESGGDSGSGGGPTPPAPQTNLNQAVLGPLAGAEIQAYRLTNLSTPVEGPKTANESRTDLSKAGTFTLNLSGIPDDEWILVTATGGWDIDANDDGVVDLTAVQNKGTIHALGKARDWRAGAKINVLTELAWREVENDIRNGDRSDIESKLRWIASGLLSSGLSVSGELDYRDMLAYVPSYLAHQQALISEPLVLAAVASAIHEGDVDAVRTLSNLYFGDSLKPPQDMTLKDVTPVLDIPVNRQSIVSSDVTVRSFASDEAKIIEGERGTVLMAQDADGKTVLLGYAMPNVAQNVLSNSAMRSAQLTNERNPEISVRSTAHALIMMMAGSGLDGEGQTQISGYILAHADFEALVADMTESFEADALFLESLGLHTSIVERLKTIGQAVFEQYLEQYQEEQQVQVAKVQRHLNSAQTKLATSFGNTFWWGSPWRSDQPWDWYGNASLVDVWNPPFLAVSTNKRSLAAMANPSMVNYSMQLFDANGSSLADPKWLMTPRNSTAIQKTINSGAAQRILSAGSKLPTGTAYVEFHKYRFKFNSINDGGAQVSALNNLHLLSSIVSLGSSVAGKLCHKITKQAETAKNIGSCALRLANTLDYYVEDSEPGNEANSLLAFIKNNGTSFTETAITDCLIPIGQELAGELIKDQITTIIGVAAAEMLAKLSNPVGWVLIVASAANEFAPLAVSYVGWGNNFAAYDLTWSGNQLMSVSPANGRPQQGGTTVRMPVASFVTSGEKGLNVTFDASSSTFDPSANPGYEWGVGDGSTPSGMIFTHTYANAGLKNIRLTVYDGLGNSHEILTTLEVGRGNPPVINSLNCSIDPDNPRRVNMVANVSDPDNDLSDLNWYRSPSDPGSFMLTSHYDQSAYVIYDDDGINAFSPALIAKDTRGNLAVATCNVVGSGGGGGGSDYTSANIGTLKYVPPGRFQRDATAGNISVISTGFRMSQHEITRAQFETVMGADPSWTNYSPGTNHPVQMVTWYHTIAFCNKLSLLEGLTPVYTVTGVNFSTLTFADIPTSGNADWNAVTADWSANGYRLSTEMEWMWAAMGATSALGYIAPTYLTGYAKPFAGSNATNAEGNNGSNAIRDYAWFTEDGAVSPPTLPVGEKLPNERGLYDMSGNVSEWCWDWIGGYPAGELTDYRGAASGTRRVVRGGSLMNTDSAPLMTVAHRVIQSPHRPLFYLGFRVVRP